MCYGTEVANPGQHRRRLAGDGADDGEAVLTTAAAPMLSRRRQAQEMSAMVSALARVVAGSAAATASSWKRPAEGELSMEEAWRPYRGELAGAGAAPSSSSSASPFLTGTYTHTVAVLQRDS